MWHKDSHAVAEHIHLLDSPFHRLIPKQGWALSDGDTSQNGHALLLTGLKCSVGSGHIAIDLIYPSYSSVRVRGALPWFKIGGGDGDTVGKEGMWIRNIKIETNLWTRIYVNDGTL
jgi:hypothetical protein